jgi:hypothetical protein
VKRNAAAYAVDRRALELRLIGHDDIAGDDGDAVDLVGLAGANFVREDN